MFDTQDCVTMQTDGLVITAASELVDSSGTDFVWGYYLCIENTSDEKVTLIGKDWNITDSAGNLFADNIPGFRGEIPEIEPGEYFEFSSQAPLKSAHAIFYGSCQVLRANHKTARHIKLPILQFNANGFSAQPLYS